jgi:hypothetical protein
LRIVEFGLFRGFSPIMTQRARVFRFFGMTRGTSSERLSLCLAPHLLHSYVMIFLAMSMSTHLSQVYALHLYFVTSFESFEQIMQRFMLFFTTILLIQDLGFLLKMKKNTFTVFKFLKLHVSFFENTADKQSMTFYYIRLRR